MQYILSEDEYKALIEKPNQVKDDYVFIINALCMEVAKHKPVPCSWDKDREPEPWGCIHAECPECGSTAEDMMCCDCNLPDEIINQMAPYCDDCPVQTMCMMRKSYSK